MRDLGPIKILEGSLQASEALINAVVGRSGAYVVAGRRDGADDLRRSGKERIVSVGPAWPSQRHLLVTDGQVGRRDHRLQARQQGCEVIAALSASPAVFLRSVPQGVVPQQIAVHHHRYGGGR